MVRRRDMKRFYAQMGTLRRHKRARWFWRLVWALQMAPRAITKKLMETALRAVPFIHAVRAEENFARLSKLLPASAIDAVPRLLVHVPDPDTALNSLERFAQAASPAILEHLGR